MWMWSAGAEVLNADKTRWTLTTPQAIRGFEFWCKLWGAGPNDPVVTPDAAHTHAAVFASMRSPFFEGRIAMLEGAAYYCGAMRDAASFRWGIGYLPKCPDGPGGKPARRTRIYCDSYVIWDRYPPNWMVNDGLLDRGALLQMRPEVQEHCTGASDVSSLSDGELAAALVRRKSTMKAAVLAEELLRIWESGPDGRAAMNEKLQAEMARRDAAWEFFKYLAGVPGQRMVARLGRSTPGRKSVAYGPYFNREDTPYDESRITNAIEFAHLQPITPNYADVRRLWQKYVDRIFLRESGVFQKLTPRQALEQMEVELNRMLERDLKAGRK
jgi:ABC-type glycerol-3-phosphate transport system substrate-binding protein